MSVNFLCLRRVSNDQERAQIEHAWHTRAVHVHHCPPKASGSVRVHTVGSGLAWDDPSSPVLCLISRITPGARREQLFLSLSQLCQGLCSHISPS